jgi:DNA-binding transcriptional regulator YiaG
MSRFDRIGKWCNDLYMESNVRYSKRNRYLVDGKKLTDARIAAGMSMEDVARNLGCNKSSVARWERGGLTPSEERIDKMTKMFKTWGFVIGNPDYREG